MQNHLQLLPVEEDLFWRPLHTGQLYGYGVTHSPILRFLGAEGKRPLAYFYKNSDKGFAS